MRDEPSISKVIGRMLMVGIRGASIYDPQTQEDLDACRAAHAGGIILFDVNLTTMRWLKSCGDSDAHARLMAERNIVSPSQLREFNRDLRLTLGAHVLIGVDQEGGRVSRLPMARHFPATHSPASLERMTPEVAKVVRRMLWSTVGECGFNVNFAPCVDVAVNPNNPIVVRNERCFSSDPQQVIRHASKWLHQANQDAVLACLKHFPGHGSSSGDTHEGFVDITSTFRPDLELEPYRALLSDPDLSIPMVMTGHLFDAAVDPQHPASLSFNHTTRTLRERFGFQGVVVTDSLDMGAITQRYSVEEACILAINAGTDILLDANNPPTGWRPCPAPAMHDAILRALSRGKIDGGEDRLRRSGHRIDRMLASLRRQA